MAGEMVEKTHGILDSFEETKVRRRHKSDSLLESTAVCGHANEQTVLNCKLTGIVANDFEADPKANALSKTSIGGESKPGTSENEVTRKRAEQRRPRMTSGGRNALGRRRINLGSTDGDRDPNEQQTGARSPEAQAEEAYGMKHFYWKVITTLSAVFFLLVAESFGCNSSRDIAMKQICAGLWILSISCCYSFDLLFFYFTDRAFREAFNRRWIPDWLRRN